MGSSLIFIYLDGHRDVHCFLSVFERRNYSISLGCPFGSGPIDCHLSELVQTVTAASRFTTVSALCITPIRVVTLWLREGDIFCAGWSQSTALRVCVCVCDRSIIQHWSITGTVTVHWSRAHEDVFVSLRRLVIDCWPFTSCELLKAETALTGDKRGVFLSSNLSMEVEEDVCSLIKDSISQTARKQCGYTVNARE